MEIKPEFLGIASINSFIPNTSSPRGIMLNSHFNSHLPLLNPESKLIKSGTEYELAKYINDCRVDEDCIVKGIIGRYVNSGIENIPEYILLVEFEKDGYIYIDYINVKTFNTSHTYFGYNLELTDEFKNLNIGSVLNKDTILSKTRSYAKDKSYAYGLNANVALMSHPSVSEDGYVVSESFCEKMKTTSLLQRTIYIDKNKIPLNLFGDLNKYKIFPDIGEYTKENGLLLAYRERNNWFNITDMENKNLMDYDPIFDTCIYVNTNSFVVDVKVIKNFFYKSDLSNNVYSQLDFYANLNIQFYKDILDRFDFIMKEKKSLYNNIDFIKITPRLRNLLMEAKVITESVRNNKIKLSYRKFPIEFYKIDIFTMNVIKPSLGFKIVDIHAAKGVITKILPDECMPIDKYGNRADIISDPSSTISRMNIGRTYEGYLGAVSRDNRLRLISYLQNKYNTNIENIVNNLSQEDIDYVYNYIHGLYNLINKDMVEFLESLNKEEIIHHIKEVLLENMYIYYPVDNDKPIIEVIKDIENSIYKPLNDKVRFKLENGVEIESKENIRICNMYYMLLEKIAHTYNSVNSAKINNFGFPIKGSTIEKHKTQHALTPTKVLGETEVRILTSYLGERAVAELLDMNLNPNTHKQVVKNILTKDNPMQISKNVDRSQYSYGQNKSLILLKHIFNASGIDIDFEKNETDPEIL